MIKIEAVLQDGVFKPREEFPKDAVQVIFDGAAYLCYAAEDIGLPVITEEHVTQETGE